MAPRPSNMTRSSSSESSAFSHITVTGAREGDSAYDRVSVSTPPTSLNETGSLGSAKAVVDEMHVVEEEPVKGRKRTRSRVSTYNLKKLSDAQQAETASSSRNVSGLTGHTLVNDEDVFEPLRSKVDKDVEMEWESTKAASPPRRSPRNVQRHTSVSDRVKKAVGKIGSVLGKRNRATVEAGKGKLGMKEEESSPQQKKVLKELDTGTKGVLDEMDLSDDGYAVPPARPAKRVRTKRETLEDTKQTVPTAPPLKITSGKAVKKWQTEGLYVGQEPGADTTQTGGRKKLQKKRPESSLSGVAAEDDAPPKKKPFMPLPMFDHLEKERAFIIPFDVYAPSAKKGDEPKDWRKVNKNRLIGDAKELWERSEKLPTSECVCRVSSSDEQGCGEDCLNRVMQYECNDDNCTLPASQCSNRAFAELAARTKKGGSFDVGVEVIKTSKRGYGVRSCRTFAPGQIIMEYSGEIISEGECQRRMREEYKDKQCYYLMELERGLIIDGTRGSMARFVNHSCDPNCEVRMVKVNGTPRMAVFAGEDGIMTGDELTYDYNFDSFGEIKQACYCGASNCRGTLSKRLNAAEQKKQAREETERKRKAAEEAQKRAAAEAKKKQVKDDRGASWRGWIAVDDPEMKEKLRAEKKEKEEAEKNSSRAKRMAARRNSLPPPVADAKLPVEKERASKRRKTTHVEKHIADEAVDEVVPEPSVPKVTARKQYKRAASSSSKFTEELAHITSTQEISTIIKQTEVSMTTTKVLQETLAIEEESITVGAAKEDNGESVSTKAGLVSTASKGKEALKNAGLAVKNGFLALDKNRPGSSNSSGKLRQSTLSFAKLN